jgi:hypothetical protein
MSPYRVNTRAGEGGRWHVALEGTLGPEAFDGLDILFRTLLGDTVSELVIDLSGVEYISPVIARVIRNTAAVAADQGLRVLVAGTPEDLAAPASHVA